MSRKCSVCMHPKLNEINKAIISGELSNRAIARQYGLSKDAIGRHAARHLPASMVEAKAAEQVAEGDDLVAQVRQLRDKGISILEAAEKDGNHAIALKGIREVRGCIELLAKMFVEMDRQARARATERGEAVDKKTHPILTISRTPSEQRDFERILDVIRDEAEKAGLALPEEE